MRFSALLPLALAGALQVYAQDPKELLDKAPPAVDDALRARIAFFYQAHVDGKFRLADQAVAEDSKDLYFAANKPRYMSFEIVRINYSDDFTKAQTVVACKQDIYVRGSKFKSVVPVTSYWKVENGDWFWYVPDPNRRETPFGTMTTQNEPATGAPSVPKDPVAAARDILSQVRIDKSEVTLSSYEPKSVQLKITNGMPGPIRLGVGAEPQLAGFRATLNKEALNAGETATLTLRYEPKDKAPKPRLMVRVTVDPTRQVLPVTVNFAIPPELERDLKNLNVPTQQR